MPVRRGFGLFGSRVGRRVFGLLAFAGLAPALLAAYLTYHESTQGLRESVLQGLRDDAKGLGMEIVAALQNRARLARAEMRRIDAGKAAPYVPGTAAGFEAAWSLDPDGREHTIFGTGTSGVELPQLDRRHLANGLPQLLTSGDGAAIDWILVFESPDATGAPGWLVFRVPAERIWEPRAYLPYEFAYCVSSATRVRLYCSDDSADPAIRSGDRAAGHAGAAASRLAAAWPLFLDGEFALDTVTITASVDEAHAMRALAGIQRIFPPLFAFIVLFVSMISLQLIRRSLVPLRKLTVAATRYAQGKLDARVDIQSRDEFAALGSAFNKMARRLGVQIRTLRTMSDVDRLIVSAATFDEIVEGFLHHLSELAACRACAVLANDADNSSLATLVSYDGARYARARVRVVSDDKSRTAPRGTANFWSPLTAADPSVAAAFDGLGVRYFTTFPMTFNEAVKGSVILASDSKRPFDGEAEARCRDLTARLAIGIASAEREEMLYRQAHFDDLTGLPNRQLLKDRLSQSLAQATRSKKTGALLFIDLDRFKEVNDVYGHTVGDDLLRQAAERIVRACRASDTVARLGGDEFVVLMPELGSGRSAGDKAIELVELLAQPFRILDADHTLGASIGIGLYPDDGNSVEILLRNTDAAMYRAKSAGRNRYEYFSEQLNVESRRRLMLEHDLRNAIRTDELQLHYQPQFHAGSGGLRGAEALLRWPHPEHGNVSPAEFIEIAEQSDLIVDIGRWVLHRACRDLRELLDAGRHPGIVAVNVSARQLSDHDFVRDVVDALTRYELEPGLLEIEITESVIAKNRETAIDTLTTLRKIGVRISMDDFGTGYSSLSYLRMLPFDNLKIDKSFVIAIGEGENAESICRAIITMAHELGKEVIAEGIETREHLEFMRRHDCEYAQGYLLGRPVPIDELRGVLERRQPRQAGTRRLEVV